MLGFSVIRFLGLAVLVGFVCVVVISGCWCRSMKFCVFSVIFVFILPYLWVWAVLL